MNIISAEFTLKNIRSIEWSNSPSVATRVRPWKLYIPASHVYIKYKTPPCYILLLEIYIYINVYVRVRGRRDKYKIEEYEWTGEWAIGREFVPLAMHRITSIETVLRLNVELSHRWPTISPSLVPSIQTFLIRSLDWKKTIT